MGVYLSETLEWIKIFIEDVFAFADEVEDEAEKLAEKIIQEDFFNTEKNIVGKRRYAPKPKTIAIVSIMLAMDKQGFPYNIDYIAVESGINKRTLIDWKKNIEVYLDGRA